jgi:alcohol dehydrogenase class IV
MTDAFCREGMQYGSGALLKAYRHGGDPVARAHMSLTSLLGGLALANAGLGAAHGFAGPIGGMFTAPHGAVCARLLPFVMETNISALRARDAGNPALRRYEEVAKLLTGKSSARAEDGVVWIQQLCTDLHIPSLSSYGVTANDIPGIVAKSAQASSMKGNPVQLTGEELGSIMERAL